MTNEFENVNRISEWYFSTQLNFDQKLIEPRYTSIKNSLTETTGFELGPVGWSLSQYLINIFEELTIVKALTMLLDQILDNENVNNVNSLFEQFSPKQKFYTIIMEHIMEYVKNPAELITRAKNSISSNDKIFTCLFNRDSIYRQAAVKMGLLNDICALNGRDRLQLALT